MNLHCLEVSEGSSCPHLSQPRQGSFSPKFCWPLRRWWDCNAGGGRGVESAGVKNVRSNVLMHCSLVPLGTSDPGLSEIPLLPLSHETKRQPCFSDFVAWALRRFPGRAFSVGAEHMSKTARLLKPCPEKMAGTAATCQTFFFFFPKTSPFALFVFLKKPTVLTGKKDRQLPHRGFHFILLSHGRFFFFFFHVNVVQSSR